MQAATAIVVDDDRDVRDRLSQAVENDDRLSLEGSFAFAFEALKFLERHHVDVVLSDIYMDELDGIDFLKILQASEPRPKFVAISSLADPRRLEELLRLGASGYVSKGQTNEQIAQAVVDALAGGTSVAPQLLTKYLAHSGGHSRGLDRALEDPRLSENDCRVLALVCQGKSNSEIAESLSYSIQTVKKKVSALLEFFDTKSRAELIALLLT